MRIAICDDDIPELEKVKNVVEAFMTEKQENHQIIFATFTNGNELLSHISKYGGFDLLILDIIMPGMNGIELAKEIRTKNDNCKIIFLTSSPEFAVHSYKVNALYYLIKPLKNNELHALLNRTLDEMEKQKSKSIVVKEKGKLTRVEIHNIEYVESIKHQIYFHLSNNKVISCYSTLNEFQEILLSDKGFVKCHKSFIVNMNYVISISMQDFIMKDKALIPISRQAYQQIKNEYIDYFFEGV